MESERVIISDAATPDTTSATAPTKAAKRKPSSCNKRSLTAHPHHKVKISAAINDLKERGRSSRHVIQKNIFGSYNVHLKAGMKTGREAGVKVEVKAAWKAGVKVGVKAAWKAGVKAAWKAGNLKQSKGRGAAASFRLHQIAKKSKAKKLADVEEAEDDGTRMRCRLEADLHRHLSNCPKNSSHGEFIPSDEFNIDKIPLHCQDPDLASYIRSLSDLTVRVTLRYVSERRPPTDAVSGKPYPGYPYRGQRRTTVGTGWVHQVLMFPDKYNSQCQTCLCHECCMSTTPMRQFAFITIYTAAHVVFDDAEGKHCTCHLFFHRNSIPEICEGVVTLTSMWRVFSDTFTDRCLMIHVTHDMDLATRLEKMVSHRDCLKESYINKCLLYRPPSAEQTEQDSLVFLVSHPHGCSSNISLGVAMGSDVDEAGVTRYMYNTATCPGSSGAKVFLLWKDWGMWGLEHTHSAGCNQGKQINYSSHGVGSCHLIRRKAGSEGADSLGESVVEQELRGPAEVEECFPEIDLHSHDMKCEKNPGHKNFTPIQKFTKDNLPPDYQGDVSHLVKAIKAQKNIVAFVKAKKISEDRSQTFPGFQGGTAWVYKVLRFSERNDMDKVMCTCKECLNSLDPKTEFAHIIIHTSGHVVSNESEGKQTTCYLFYDEGRTELDCKDVVELSGMSRVWSDVEKDVCKMLYVTHDPDVIDRVEKAVNEWESARKSFELMNKINSTSLQGSSSSDASNQPLAIIVSHPHGCSKQVSIGRCVSIDDKGNGQTVCTYTTPTCPGCSGAYVYVVGREYQSWDNHIHLGEHGSSGDTQIGFSN